MLSWRTVYSAILALLSLLGLTQLLDALDVWYFPMIHGRAYSLKFDLGFSLVPILLPLSAVVLGCLFKWKKIRGILISVAASLCLYWILGFQASMALLSLLLTATSLYQLGNIGEYMTWTLYFLTGFEGAALSHWMLLPFGFHSPFVEVAELELALFYVFAPLAPIIVLIIIPISILKLTAPGYLETINQIIKPIIVKIALSFRTDKLFSIPSMILMVISLIVSIIGAIYPHSPSINPEEMTFGVDVHYYLEWMVPVEKDPFSVFTVANGSRPIFLLLIYVFRRGLGLSVVEAVKYLPVLINPFLVLSVYFMVSWATDDREWAALASFFSASGFLITVEMYSYFLTNMFGLSLIFFALGFLFRAINTEKILYLILSSIFGSLLVFTHPWTFAQYYVATVLFLVYLHIKEKRFNISLYVLLFLLLTGFADILKLVIGGLEAYRAISLTGFNMIELMRFWNNNIFAFRQMYGGLLSNTVLLGLAALGVYLLNHKKIYNIYLMLLLLISLSYYFIVDGSDQTKLLYNMPFSVLSSFVILFILRDSILDTRRKMVSLLFIVIYMMTYFLRSLANLV
jgi:hypothetical protein